MAIEVNILTQPTIQASIKTFVATSEDYQNGYSDGYDKGKIDGEKQGAQAEYDRFWDAFQNNGEPCGYQYAFAVDRFTDANYNPKYPIRCQEDDSRGRYVFYNQSGITDTKVDIYTNSINADYFFALSYVLKTVRLFHVQESTTFVNTFNSCIALENITIGGTIGKDINFSSCSKLTHDSLMSILEHLGTVSAKRTCTLGSTNLAKLTDAEKAIATQKGWTLA